MTIKATITAIQKDLAAALPGLLEAEAVQGITYYTLGYPENQEDLWCCVRLASLKDRENLEFIIHLSLPHVGEAEAYSYMQGVKHFLDETFFPGHYGYDTGTYKLQVSEVDPTYQGIQTLFNVTMARMISDGD
jgi:hypothetical protein